MSKLAADSQTSSAKVLHATLNDGKIYFKSVQGTSQYVIIFFFWYTECNILCAAANTTSAWYPESRHTGF